MDQTDTAHYPVAILQDRYNGLYSKGKWLAISEADYPDGSDSGKTRMEFCIDYGPSGDDTDARHFWSEPPDWIAVGNTPDEALKALVG